MQDSNKSQIEVETLSFDELVAIVEKVGFTTIEEVCDGIYKMPGGYVSEKALEEMNKHLLEFLTEGFVIIRNE